LRKEKQKMKGKSYVSIALIAMFIFSSIMTVGLGAWTPPSPGTWYHMDDYVYSTAADLTGTKFNVTVSIYNVTLLGAWEFKFTYNTTLLDALLCYKTTFAEDKCEYFGPADPILMIWTNTSGINDTIGGGLGQVHAGASVKTGQEPTGDVDLMIIEFEITYAPPQLMSIDNTVSCDLAFTTTIMGDNFGSPIPHMADDGYYEYTREGFVPGAPTCCFIMPSTVYVGDTVNFLDCSTDGGFPPLTYAWDLDGDGAYDDSTAQNPSKTYSVAGVFLIKLNVTNSINYWDNCSKSLKVVLPLGPKIDVWTQDYRQYPEGTITPFDGKGVFVDCDSYAPGENVSLWAGVSYNDELVQNILVGFEVFDPLNRCVTYRVDRTDEWGVAQVWFRIPIPCSPAEQLDLFGHWTVIAKAKVQDDIINDTMGFKVGFIVEITELEVTPTAVYKCEYLQFNVTIKNIGWVNRTVYLIVVVYDECDVPIGQVIDVFTIDEAAAVLCSEFVTTRILELHVPKWAYVGFGKVYANAFTNLPRDCGIPYCPEVYQPVEILQTYGPPDP
jgi:hypothetical protein